MLSFDVFFVLYISLLQPLQVLILLLGKNPQKWVLIPTLSFCQKPTETYQTLNCQYHVTALPAIVCLIHVETHLELTIEI